MRPLFAGLLLSTLIVTTACGGGGSTTASGSGSLSGNWQIALARVAAPHSPLTYTGFLTQSGDSVKGSLILGTGFLLSPGCSGVGPVTGSVKGQTVSLNINQFGGDVSLTGTAPSSSAPMTGEFSFLASGCNDFPGTGTWSAFQVKPISGSFHGTFTSTLPPPNNGTIEVVGTLTQGPNTGTSTASLMGTISAQGAPHFCSYLSTADITGLISGTSASLELFGPNGSLITEIGQIGQIGNPQVTAQATFTADGTALSAPYTFPAISTSCIQDQGTFQITFP